MSEAYWYRKVVGGYRAIVVRADRSAFTLIDLKGELMPSTLWQTEEEARAACFARNESELKLAPEEVERIARAYNTSARPVRRH